MLKSYAEVSVLRLNVANTEIYDLGQDNSLPGVSNLGLKITQDIQLYGLIWVNKDVQEMEYKNSHHRLKKIKNLLKMRWQVDLSLKGKITVLKVLAMQQLVYLLTLLSYPTAGC